MFRKSIFVVILFIVTTFTFSKNESSCNGKTDLRIRFSNQWTIVNCLLSTIIIALVSYWLTNEQRLGGPDDVLEFLIIFTPIMVLQIIGVICTLSFVWFDRVSCCCCACWRRGQEEVVVYDPDNPEASLVLRDGEIIERNEQGELTQHTETDM